MAGDQVRFRWRDYRHHNKSKVMTLAADEFIRRFLLHTLPYGFHRIRHYGFLGNRHRAEKLALCRRLLAISAAAPSTMLTNLDRPRTATSTRVLGAAGAGRGSPLSRGRAQPIPRHGTTAHEPRGLVPMINALTIFTAGAAEQPAVARHATPAASPPLHEARSLGVAFVNGAPARRSPVTAPLPASLRATFSPPRPAFYSP